MSTWNDSPGGGHRPDSLRHRSRRRNHQGHRNRPALIVAAGIVTGRLALRELDGEELIFAGHSVGGNHRSSTSRAYSATKTQCVSCACAPTAWRRRQPPPRPAWLQYSAALKNVREAIDAAGLVAANSNGGGQIVATGPHPAIEAFAANPPARARVIPSEVAGAFHTEAMAPPCPPWKSSPLPAGLRPDLRTADQPRRFRRGIR